MALPMKCEKISYANNLQTRYDKLPSVLKEPNGMTILPHNPLLATHPWGCSLGDMWDSPGELGGGFVLFLKHVERRPQFLKLLAAPDKDKDFPFFVDHMEVYKFDPMLAHTLTEHNDVCNMLLCNAIILVQKEYLTLIERRFANGRDADVHEDDVPFLNPSNLSVKGERHFNMESENFSKGMGPTDGFTATRIHPRVTNLHFRFHKESVSDIKATDVDKIMQITGVVTRAHKLKSLEYKRYLRCAKKKCGHCISIMANFETEGYEIDQGGISCDRPLEGEMDDEHARRCCNDKFDVIARDFCDFQEIKIQESSSTLRAGAIPRSLTLILTHDMCNKVNPGDEVRAIGILMSRWSPPTDETRPDIKTSLRALSIEVTNNSQSLDLWQGADTHKREDMKVKFTNFWMNREHGDEFLRRQFILRAVCPRLFGLDMVKLGLICSLIGGVENDDDDEEEGDRAAMATSEDGKEGGGTEKRSEPGSNFRPVWARAKKTSQPSPAKETQPAEGGLSSGSSQPEQKKMKIRTQSHILMVGDPGTGKSQLLKFAQALVPRSVMTTGVGTTTAGLTCSAVREGGKGSKGDWTLEAGALVLADRGVCCIDEFGCMHKEDQVSMLEAMESQTISVNKAGIHTQLTARTTVIASTNPKGSRFDDTKSLTQNTGVDPPLLSRFDLIFIMTDVADIERNVHITDHLLCAAIKGDSHFTGGGKKASSLDQASTNEDYDPMGPPWDIETLKGYIATVKDNFKPKLSEEAKLLLTEHYIAIRKKGQSPEDNPVTIRFLQSLKRLSQAHARLMYRNVVTEDDAIATILLMESTVNNICRSGFMGGSSENNFAVDCMAENTTHYPGFYQKQYPEQYKNDEYSPDAYFQNDKKIVKRVYIDDNESGDQMDPYQRNMQMSPVNSMTMGTATQYTGASIHTHRSQTQPAGSQFAARVNKFWNNSALSLTVASYSTQNTVSTMDSTQQSRPFAPPSQEPTENVPPASTNRGNVNDDRGNKRGVDEAGATQEQDLTQATQNKVEKKKKKKKKPRRTAD